MSGVAGSGAVLVWPGGTLWIGTAYRPTDPHEHHAIQISLGGRGTIQFALEDAGPKPYPGCIIAPDRRHAFHGDGNLFIHVWIEPESAEGRRLIGLLAGRAIMECPGSVREVARELFAGWARRAPGTELIALARMVIGEAAGGLPPVATTDPRIMQAIRLIRSRLSGTVRQGDIAREVNLSAGRFRHLFVSETGMTFRSYVLWQRLHHVFEAMGGGRTSLSQAAHEAGFADAAHMTRTFKRMLGLAPSQMQLE